MLSRTNLAGTYANSNGGLKSGTHLIDMSPYLPSYSALMNHAHARAMVSMTRISVIVATPSHHLPNAGTMRGGGCTAVSEEVSFPRALMHHDTHHVHGGTHLIDMSPYLPSHSALMHHAYAQGYLAHKNPPPVGPYSSPAPGDLW